MKKIIAGLALLISFVAQATTTVPSSLINWTAVPTWPSQSAGFVFAAPTGASGAPTFRALAASDLPTVTVAKGGTGATSASGTALDNITGFSSTGFISRTGAGTYTFTATIPVASGGTGATSAATALTNLGAAATSGTLAQFASTTSAQLAGVLSDETGTGVVVFGTTPTITTPNVVGVTNGSSAATGSLGEVLSTSTTGTSMSSGTAANCTSKSLTAGEYLVWGNLAFAAAASTTVSAIYGGTNTTSATLPANSALVALTATFATGATQLITTTPTIVNVSTTTTVFLVGMTTFGASTMTCSGYINALRVR